MVAQLRSLPADRWRRIRLSNVGRAHRTPRVLESRPALKDYPGDIRQLAVADLGHENPTLLLTNRMDEPAARLVDRYARRMVIGNAIAEAIDFFHMDALSAAVPMKIDVDLQLTLIASVLYRILGIRAGNGHARAGAGRIFRDLVRASGEVGIGEGEITVRLGRRACNPLLLAAGYDQTADPIPWLGNRVLTLRFP